MKLIVLALLFCAIVFAAEDEGVKAAERKPRAERSYVYKATKDAVTVKAENKDSGVKDQMTFTAKTDGSGARIVIDYKSDPEKDKMKEFDVNYRVFVRNLVEYVPNSPSDDGYVKGNTVVNYYPGSGKGAGGWKWNDFTEDASSTNTTKIYVASTSDNIFALTIKFNKPAAVEGGVQLNPNDVKFDIDFNYDVLKQNGYLLNATNRIAILGVVQSKFRTEKCNDSTTAICLNDNTGRIAGYLQWADHVTCGGTIKPVTAAHLDIDNTKKDGGDNNDANVAIWSVHGDIVAGSCKWDPVISTNENSASSMIMSVALLAAMALLAMLF